jgi:hypothetical protein
MRKRLAYFAQHSCIKDHSAKVTYTFYVMLHHLKADPGRVGTHVELRKLDILEFPCREIRGRGASFPPGIWHSTTWTHLTPQPVHLQPRG